MDYEHIRHVFAQHGERDQYALLHVIAADPEPYREAILQMWESEKKPSVLRWVADALCCFPDAKATNFVLSALRHANMTVRLHAASGIYRCGRDELLGAVKELIRDPSGGVRLRALMILTDKKVLGLAEVLALAREDEKKYIRDYARKYEESARQRQT